jgi:hypothetical protein
LRSGRETACTADNPAACTVPPANAPGHFYPYWSRVNSGFFGCYLEFGNVSSGPGVDNLGGDAQYGANQLSTLGYPEFKGPVLSNACGRDHGRLARGARTGT